jgi:hypothetical protein
MRSAAILLLDCRASLAMTVVLQRRGFIRSEVVTRAAAALFVHVFLMLAVIVTK